MSTNSFNFRIGFGVDVHQLLEGRSLIIGGVQIEAKKGALGHSDADALLHAICDALLGAANLRDIGHHFPDTDPAYKNVDSKELLAKSHELIRDKGYVLVNLDCTVMLEEPKLNPHIPEMQKIIGQILEVSEEVVSIKATRGEKMGPVGEGKAIQVYATVLIAKV